ncbi:ABC transporter ATP-binding protein [Magnetovibrio sp.]|uniref:ABC transporter ATP-binding protein n=1 Tax=Magnetovibrio sp. TaxID=2024836 RepID=UPI002F946A30
MTSLIDMTALGSVMPVVSLVIDPSTIDQNVYFIKAMDFIGATTHTDKVIVTSSTSIALLFVAALLKLFNQYAINIFSARCQNRLANDLMTACIAAPYSWFLKANTALTTRMFQNDINVWGRNFINQLLILFDNLIITLIAIVAVVSLMPLAGVFGLLTIGFIAALALYSIRPHLNRLIHQKKRAEGLTMLAAYQTISGIREVKFSGETSFFRKAFNKAFSSFSFSHHMSSVLHILPSTSVLAIGQIGLVAIVAILGTSETNTGTLASTLALLLLIASRVVPAVNQITARVTSLWSFIPWMDGLLDFQKSLDAALRESALHTADQKKPIEAWDSLSLSDVEFVYPGTDQTVIKNINLRIEKGRSYGIVGASGSGKSTLVGIIVGLLEPTHGVMRISGEDMSTFDLTTWQHKIGYVTQEPFIADDTLLANVAFGRERHQVDIDFVMNCLHKANLDKYVEDLPQGLDTSLGDRGKGLSGGQRQRVAIARAIFKKPEILVLDEATSALDTMAEQKVQHAIENLHGEMTIISIAHRLSTLKNMDQIIVMDGGKIVDQGTFAELSARSSSFQDLLSSGDSSKQAS